MPFIVAADGTELAYESYGQGDPVLFCNGVMLSTSMWDYQVPFLVDRGYRCVLHDVRLAGHSGGAAVAARYLAEHASKRVHNLTLLSPMLPFLKRTPDNPGGLPEDLFDGLMSALRTDRTRWLADQQQLFFASHLKQVSPNLIDWTRRDCEAASMYAVLALQRHVFHDDNRRFVDEIDVPTLVMHGAADFSAPVEVCGRPTAAAIAHSKYVELPDAGHGMYASHYESVNDELLRFFG
jgi:non-heme chloroperoxidase